MVDLQLEGQTVLYFAVPKSTEYVHLTSDGRCLQRRDLATVPIASEAITFSRQEQRSREYDREFVEGPQADALDLGAVGAVADVISHGMSPEKCLQFLDLAEYAIGRLKLRRAALLVFARDPARWHPRLQIRIIKVKGTDLGSGEKYNVVSDMVVEGNVLQLVERAWEVLRPYLTETRLTPGARFASRIMYPELACREALVNAVAHRDYAQEGRGIEIYVFDDRMEVTSPGGLLSTITVKDLLRLEGAHQSRNSLVCRVLRESGYMRELGEGVRRMFELMKSNELAPPEIKARPDRFTVVLHHKPMYSQEHILWLEEFATQDLTPEEKAIVILGYGGRLVAPNEIFKNLGLVDTERYRQLVASLQKKGILQSELAKPEIQRLARRQRVGARDIPRFSIRVPSPELPTVQHQTPLLEPTGGPQARLFVGGVSDSVTASALLEEFSKYGRVEEVYLPRTSAGRSKGYAFVQMESRPAALAALKGADGRKLGGRSLAVRPALPRTTPGDAAEESTAE